MFQFLNPANQVIEKTFSFNLPWNRKLIQFEVSTTGQVKLSEIHKLSESERLFFANMVREVLGLRKVLSWQNFLS